MMVADGQLRLRTVLVPLSDFALAGFGMYDGQEGHGKVMKTSI